MSRLITGSYHLLSSSIGGCPYRIITHRPCIAQVSKHLEFGPEKYVSVRCMATQVKTWLANARKSMQKRKENGAIKFSLELESVKFTKNIAAPEATHWSYNTIAQENVVQVPTVTVERERLITPGKKRVWKPGDHIAYSHTIVNETEEGGVNKFRTGGGLVGPQTFLKPILENAINRKMKGLPIISSRRHKQTEVMEKVGLLKSLGSALDEITILAKVESIKHESLPYKSGRLFICKFRGEQYAVRFNRLDLKRTYNEGPTEMWRKRDNIQKHRRDYKGDMGQFTRLDSQLKNYGSPSPLGTRRERPFRRVDPPPQPDGSPLPSATRERPFRRVDPAPQPDDSPSQSILASSEGDEQPLNRVDPPGEQDDSPSPSVASKKGDEEPLNRVDPSGEQDDSPSPSVASKKGDEETLNRVDPPGEQDDSPSQSVASKKGDQETLNRVDPPGEQDGSAFREENERRTNQQRERKVMYKGLAVLPWERKEFEEMNAKIKVTEGTESEPSNYNMALVANLVMYNLQRRKSQQVTKILEIKVYDDGATPEFTVYNKEQCQNIWEAFSDRCQEFTGYPVQHVYTFWSGSVVKKTTV